MTTQAPLHTETDDEGMVAMSTKPGRLTLISLVGRPGVLRFLSLLEHDHFPPGTPANADFELVVLHWPDDIQIPWLVTIIPTTAEPIARRLATEAGLRFANGVPHVLSMPEGGVEGGRHVERTFPINHPRAFTLENDEESPLYLPGGDEFMRAEERLWLENFRRERGIQI